MKKEKKVRKSGGEWKVVHFKYEKLGTFCLLCGLLGHGDQFCGNFFELKNYDGTRGWGPELLVEQCRAREASSSW